jgi:hypothetical protein
MGFFGWLRGQVKAAVLGGIQDAVDEAGAAEFAPARLELRLDALSAPAADANGNGRTRKARVGP